VRENRWIKLKRLIYKDSTGKERVWEMAARNKPIKPDPDDYLKTTVPDGVGIVAIITSKQEKDDHILLGE